MANQLTRSDRVNRDWVANRFQKLEAIKAGSHKSKNCGERHWLLVAVLFRLLRNRADWVVYLQLPALVHRNTGNGSQFHFAFDFETNIVF